MAFQYEQRLPAHAFAGTEIGDAVQPGGSRALCAACRSAPLSATRLLGGCPVLKQRLVVPELRLEFDGVRERVGIEGVVRAETVRRQRERYAEHMESVAKVFSAHVGDITRIQVRQRRACAYLYSCVGTVSQLCACVCLHSCATTVAMGLRVSP